MKGKKEDLGPKCSICGASPAKGATLFRNNRKGVDADWRCRVHLDLLPDQQVLDIAELVGEWTIPRWDQKRRRYV